MKLKLPRRRVWRAALYLASLFLVLLAADALWVQARRTIHPGFDTTRIVAPVLDDGSIDYLSAADARFGAGVTAENNAAILILQALGRAVLARYQPADGLTDVLGMPHLPEQGNYFVTYQEYCRQHALKPTQLIDVLNPRRWPVTFDATTLQWMKDNEKPLALISEAAHRTRFFIPFYGGYRPATMIEIQLPHVLPLRDACRALQTRAQIKLAADDVAGFRADLLTVHRIARLLPQGATVLERMLANIMETSACETDRVGIVGGKLSADQAQSMADDLAALGDLPPMADSLDIGERYFALGMMQALASKNPIAAGRLIHLIVGQPDSSLGLPVFLFLPIPYESAMRNFNHYQDGALAVLRQPSYPARLAALVLLEQQISSKIGQGFTLLDLAQPHWPVELFSPGLRYALEREETARVENRLTQVALALSVFKAKQGHYPATLQELATTSLKQIPDDNFSDKPLIYAPTQAGYTLYSVGPNMRDDGGKSAGPADDISASLP